MDDRDRPSRGVSRRRALAGGLAIMAGAAPFSAKAALTQGTTARTLKLYHLHTGEKANITYYSGGWYHPDALHELNVFLRDFRTNDIAQIDRDLFDLLHNLQRRIDTGEPFEIVSGYRSPETNQMLMRTTRGVAAHSLHTVGMAVDVRVPGRSAQHIYAAARNLHLGGVGYYPKSDFVHLDVGRVRTWDGPEMRVASRNPRAKKKRTRSSG
jgi:uncharacterized protein YcbK (DUF882 family)